MAARRNARNLILAAANLTSAVAAEILNAALSLSLSLSLSHSLSLSSSSLPSMDDQSGSEQLGEIN